MKTKLFLGMILALALWSSVWAWQQDQWVSQRFFTTQSVWLVVLSMSVALVFGLRHRFSVLLISITTMNMVITGSVFHLLLEVEHLHFQAHLSHTILPILMLLVFFFFLNDSLTWRRFYWLLLYPFAYLSFFIVYGPTLMWYPYPFMDVSVLGLAAVLRFSLGILTPVFTGLALGLLTLQTKRQKKTAEAVR